jgi:hypothetical protein
MSFKEEFICNNRSGWGDMDWIDLAPDRDGWRDVVNAVMNLMVP